MKKLCLLIIPLLAISVGSLGFSDSRFYEEKVVEAVQGQFDFNDEMFPGIVEVTVRIDSPNFKVAINPAQEIFDSRSLEGGHMLYATSPTGEVIVEIGDRVTKLRILGFYVVNAFVEGGGELEETPEEAYAVLTAGGEGKYGVRIEWDQGFVFESTPKMKLEIHTTNDY